jgi:hypothetical protein
MANVRERIGKEVEALLKEGLYLLGEFSKKDDSKFRGGYQIWYTRALAVVQQLIPERLGEFTTLYDEKDRIYTVAWYLKEPVPSFGGKNDAYMRFLQQCRILESAQTRLDDILTNIHGLVQAEILDSEIDAATELSKAGHIRAAGTIAGVVLERHLAKVCSSRNLTTRKKKPTLSDWNDILKDANVYDIPTWRGIQRLTDIRNLCTHAKDRDPTKKEVDELISEVERITKTIF